MSRNQIKMALCDSIEDPKINYVNRSQIANETCAPKIGHNSSSKSAHARKKEMLKNL